MEQDNNNNIVKCKHCIHCDMVGHCSLNTYSFVKPSWIDGCGEGVVDKLKDYFKHNVPGYAVIEITPLPELAGRNSNSETIVVYEIDNVKYCVVLVQRYITDYRTFISNVKRLQSNLFFLNRCNLLCVTEIFDTPCAI